MRCAILLFCSFYPSIAVIGGNFSLVLLLAYARIRRFYFAERYASIWNLFEYVSVPVLKELI